MQPILIVYSGFTLSVIGDYYDNLMKKRKPVIQDEEANTVVVESRTNHSRSLMRLSVCHGRDV